MASLLRILGLFLLFNNISGISYADVISASGVGELSAGSVGPPVINMSARAQTSALDSTIAQGSFVLDIGSSAAYSFFISAFNVCTNSKGTSSTTASIVGWYYLNGVKTSTLATGTAAFVAAPGSRGSLSINISNYQTSAPLLKASYNLVSGGMGMVGEPCSN